MTFVPVLTLVAASFLVCAAACAVAAVRGVRGAPRRRVRGFAGLSVLLLVPAALIYLVGATAGGLDQAEACALSGHLYDGDYAFAHRSDSFPLHHPCNADHDLVAGWVNPALASLVLAAVACAGIVGVIGLGSRRSTCA